MVSAYRILAISFYQSKRRNAWMYLYIIYADIIFVYKIKAKALIYKYKNGIRWLQTAHWCIGIIIQSGRCTSHDSNNVMLDHILKWIFFVWLSVFDHFKIFGWSFYSFRINEFWCLQKIHERCNEYIICFYVKETVSNFRCLNIKEKLKKKISI